MAWYADLGECDYFGEAVASSLCAVGWLERDKQYQHGSVAPEVYSKLVEFCIDPWQPMAVMGVHECGLCRYASEARGASCLFIPGSAFAYVCPELICHYMNAHDYAPPEEFCRAVLECPPMRSNAYLKSLLACARPLVRLSKGA